MLFSDQYKSVDYMIWLSYRLFTFINTQADLKYLQVGSNSKKILQLQTYYKCL